MNGILGRMAQAKADYFAGQGDMTLAREMLAFVPNFAPQLEGAPPHAYGALTIGDGPTLDLSCSQPSPLT